MIYCDNAALHPLLSEVKEVIRDFLDADYCNPSAIYSGGYRTRKVIENARAVVAESIGADPEEIYFTSGATEGVNWFCHFPNSDDRFLLMAGVEHKAALRNIGRRDFLPVDENGVIVLDRFRNIVTSLKGAFSVVVGWVNNEIGTIQPIKEIADICREARACLCIDATQAIGRVPINVHELGCSVLVGSFGKLGGLSGSGFIYIRDGAWLDPMIKGGGQERGMRAGTENIIGILCGAKAIEVATRDIVKRAEATAHKRDRIICELLKLPKTYLNGSLGNRVCNNVNIAFAGVEAETLVLQLDLAGITASAGSACNSADMQPSHVLKAIGLGDDLARSSVRFTIGDDMTDEEVDYLIATVREKIRILREASPAWRKMNAEDISGV